MKRHTLIALLIAGLATAICGGCGNAGIEEGAVSGAPGVETEPDDPTILVRPFTADEIRGEWVEGLVLTLQRTSLDETVLERWTVMVADEEGAEIEYATVADDGSVVGEPAVTRTTWTELRDHASFPVTSSTREWVTQSTALGDFDGWLYRVVDEDAGTVQEFFFTPDLPGAPLVMRIFEGDTRIFQLEQIERLQPVTR